MGWPAEKSPHAATEFRRGGELHQDQNLSAKLAVQKCRIPIALACSREVSSCTTLLQLRNMRCPIRTDTPVERRVLVGAAREPTPTQQSANHLRSDHRFDKCAQRAFSKRTLQIPGRSPPCESLRHDYFVRESIAPTVWASASAGMERCSGWSANHADDQATARRIPSSSGTLGV